VKKDVFVSYKSSDAAFVDKLEAFFAGLGVNVYVDRRDPALPRIPNVETARTLREAVKGAKRLIVIVSEDTAYSGPT
jgi:hypothetical protein